MSLSTIAIVVDVPTDQETGVESAAASAVRTLQDAGITVTAASFGGTSLLPTPAEALRAAIDHLTAVAASKPSASELQAAVGAVDDAARVVEAAGPAAAPTGAPGQTSVALPDDTPAPAPAVDPTPVVDPTPAVDPAPADATA